ncbi:MAG: HPr family phosphocarrier protein [Acetatifactor sp.]|nr:HPr family phosphocarrier protein [Acetatifactor sp.]
MKAKTIRINMDKGLDARPIALLVQEASKYDSKIYVEQDGRRINAKSIMGMMTVVLNNGEEVTVTAEGEDESVAIDSIEKFLCSN